MPRYIVVDSQDHWLDIGLYDSPGEALEGGLLGEKFDTPQRIFLYEVVSTEPAITYERGENGEYSKVP